MSQVQITTGAFFRYHIPSGTRSANDEFEGPFVSCLDGNGDNRVVKILCVFSDAKNGLHFLQILYKDCGKPFTEAIYAEFCFKRRVESWVLREIERFENM